MVKISLESENLIKAYEYDPIKFYGIIFCYLNYYDYNKFQNFLNKLYKEKCEILYEILIIYFSQFSNPIKNDEKDFFVNFIEFIISKKDFSVFTLGLSFINDMDIFIYVIDKIKEKIYNKYIKKNIDKKNYIPIELKDNLVFKEETLKGLNDIINRIISINKFSEEKKFILVNFKSDFWESILKEFRKINPNPKYFEVCTKLRNIFKEYVKFIQTICDKKKDKDIIQDIENYINIDEFAYILNEKIKNYFELEKGKITNSEILGYIQQYNPYYKEENYKNKRDSYILDFLNFDCDYNDEYAIMEHKRFIETFKKLEYEDIFKDKLLTFLDRVVNKIKNLSSFETVINLIRIDKLKDKDKEYLEKLKNKFEQKIKTEIEKLNNNNTNKPVEIIAKFVKLIFENENNFEFLRNNISKLKICPLIYIQLIKICKDDKYKTMKEFIYTSFLNHIDNIHNIIQLIDSLDKKEKEKFLKELMKKCEFTKEEFYSAKENYKINLLYALYKNKKIIKISGIIETTLTDIFNDLEKEEIEKKNLEEFLSNSKDVVEKRLGIIKLKYEVFGIENILEKLKKILDNIKNDIKILTRIKKSLSISQRERYQKEIREMIEIIKNLDNIKITEYNSDSLALPIVRLKNQFEIIVRDVDLVQDFLLFKVIYDNTKGNNQEIRFKKAKEKLEEIKISLENKKKPDLDEIYKNNKENFDIIKIKIINNEKRSEKFFKDFKEYFKIGENKEFVEDIIILFNSKKYELDLKSLLFFFNNFSEDKKWDIKLLNKYEKLSDMNLKDMKNYLEVLKKEGIYDYQAKNNYSKLFTSLYEKKEAFDFLNSKINKGINELYNMIDPNYPVLTIKDIDDTKKCIKVFKNLKTKKSNKQIFEYIKSLKDDEIKAFESYSKIYSIIIELNRKENSKLNLFDKVDCIIKNAKFVFLQKRDFFSYNEKNNITMEELIYLKTKINISLKEANKKKRKKIKRKI